MMHFGYSDLSGQLRSALDRFDGVRLAPFWLVAGLIVGLPAADRAGRLLLPPQVGRPHAWTWLTFPLMVLAGLRGGVRAGLPAQGRRAQAEPGRSGRRGCGLGPAARHTWLNLFSPRMESFDLSVAPSLPEEWHVPEPGEGRAFPGSHALRSSGRATGPNVDGLAGPAGQRARRHESPHRRCCDLDRALQFLAGARTPCAACPSRCGRPRASPPAGTPPPETSFRRPS